MPGYEDLSPEQIVYLAQITLAAITMIMLGKVIPVILQFKTMKYLEVKLKTKQCNDEVTPFKRLLNWIKERKVKKEKYYLERYKK